jgi:hypothetical protein
MGIHVRARRVAHHRRRAGHRQPGCHPVSCAKVNTTRRLLAVLLALLPWGAALAHPHGTMQCSMAVGFESGRPALLSGRLLMDAAHSREMLAMLRDPATGQLDALRQQRFLFSLKMQLARSNWLLGAQARGIAAALSPAQEPVLVLTDDGRVGVDVSLRLELPPDVPGNESADLAKNTDGYGTTTAANANWQFFCADPTYYWVTEFAAPATPLTVTGCAAPVQSMAVAVATGPRAGSVHVEMRCALLMPILYPSP